MSAGERSEGGRKARPGRRNMPRCLPGDGQRDHSHARTPPPPPVGLWSDDKCDDAALMMGQRASCKAGYYAKYVCIPIRMDVANPLLLRPTYVPT